MKFTDLPAYFRQIRENLGYSRYHAAQMAQMNNESLKDLENGETYQKILGNFDRLMKAYNIHSITITDGSDDPCSLTVNFKNLSPAGRDFLRKLLEREEQLKAAAILNHTKHKQKGQ